MVPVFSISPMVFFLLLLLVLRSFYESQFNAELLAHTAVPPVLWSVVETLLCPHSSPPWWEQLL